MAPGRLLVICGPSGVGKGTVIAELRRRHPALGLSLSWTTRPKRSGEVDGEHYRFVDEPAFRSGIADDEFAEYVFDRGHFYGTPWAEVRDAVDEGRDLLLEIDVAGARAIKERFKDAIVIFIAPPSEAVLAERLRGRGTDDPDQIRGRLEAAKDELSQQNDFDHRVENAQVTRAVEEIEGILGLSP